MLKAETNVPASDVLVSNVSPVKYKNGVKTGKSNVEDKTHDQSDSKGEDSKNARREVNDVHQSEKMIYEVNQNGNNMLVDRSVDPQMKTNATTITTDGDARSDEFPKVTIEVTNSFIEKALEPASPMFLINPSTTNAGQHSGEAFENIFAMMDDGEDDEGSPEDQAAFIGKLGTFYKKKAMEFKLPKFYGHLLNCLKTCTTVSWTFRNFYEKLFLPYERHRTQNGELQLPIAPSHVSWGIDNEGSGYQISASGRAVRDSVVCCRLGWQEQHFLGYGEDRSANNTPKRAKSLKISGSIKHQGQNEVEHQMKAAEIETSKPLDVQVVDVGPPTDWVKINVRETVRVQSDPAGHLVITGQPNQRDNLWGVTAFKKVVTLPSRIDQLRTNVVVTLHGCLHVHVPFAQQNLISRIPLDSGVILGLSEVLVGLTRGSCSAAKRIGNVSYELELSQELAAVHPVFHISMLKKCIGDPSLILPTKSVRIKDNLSYEEVPVQILDRQVRRLRMKDVASVKVLWRNQFVEEATWEAEKDIKKRYPHLFESGGNAD
ncbi:hypothetical protein MTR67_011564 [Solanum verrucosum]|uniref:Uncharacterized protein n=1 Tax=Solanum verrucosum TaxID=315347 RepID=A0AAF0Q721_SOLVR|nr:hypothetical protein MTR67_011564 [Solanum verrucosum]